MISKNRLLNNFSIVLSSTTLFLFLLFLSETADSQFYIVGGDNSHMRGKEWISPESLAILKSLKVVYRKPDIFKEAYQVTECFKPNSKLALMLTCVPNKLYTEGEDFVAFMPIHPIISPEDVIDWKKIIPNFKYEINLLHLNQVRHIIKCAYGEQAAGQLQKYLKYYSQEDTKRKFNADTAITFTVELETKDYYKDEYKYFDVFLIQKNGRGFLPIYSFYNEKGKRNIAKYREAVEGMLRYEE